MVIRQRLENVESTLVVVKSNEYNSLEQFIRIAISIFLMTYLVLLMRTLEQKYLRSLGHAPCFIAVERIIFGLVFIFPTASII